MGLVGCALSDPLIAGTPTPVPADPVLAAQIDAAVPLMAAAEQAVAAQSADDPGDASLEAILVTLAAQHQVLTGPAPLNRTPGYPVAPATPDGSADADAALSTARDACAANAVAQPGRPALFWAALAASAEQMRLGLSLGYATARPAQPDRTVTTATPSQALINLIAAYHQAVFYAQASPGFVDPGSELRQRLADILAGLQSHRDALIQLAGAQGVDPPASLGIYDLPSGRDQAAILARLGDALEGLVEAAGVWVASASQPDEAVAELIYTASVGLPLGLGTAVWPGFPD